MTAENGKIVNPATKQSIPYAELTRGENLVKTLPADVASAAVSPASKWTVAGSVAPKVDGRDFVTGAHKYPSDMTRPGMMHGKILRPVAFEATLVSLDSTKAEAMPGVKVVRDGDFVGVVAPDLFTAEQALAALASGAKWKETPGQPSNQNIFEYLKKNADAGSDRVGAENHRLGRAGHGVRRREALADLHGRVHRARTAGAARRRRRVERREADGLDRLAAPVRASARSSPRRSGSRTRTCACSSPTPAPRTAASTPATRPSRRPVCRRPPASRSRSSGRARRSSPGRTCAPPASSRCEAARARTARSSHGNSTTTTPAPPASRTPYDVANQKIQFHPVKSPLRQGSYRALASTANHFARESHMDELAHELGMDPLAFRLKNLSDPRLKAVFEAAADKFGWAKRKPAPGRGFGIAGGTEKGGYIALCAEVEVDQPSRRVQIRRIAAAFECGAVVNPNGLRNQVEGAIIQGIGGALFEAIRFENGRITNPHFSQYRLPRVSDVPAIELVILDRKDLPSAGAGEAPIVGLAPAVAGAIFEATGERRRGLPLGDRATG